MTEVGICYGMTETSPVSTRPAPTTRSTAGYPPWAGSGPHLEVKVIDPEDRPDRAARHTPGELCTRGYSLMIGYWNQPDKTAEAPSTRRTGCTPGTSR